MEDPDSDSEGTAVSLTVASVLGTRGPLRFRAHGSGQKAHVMLRRVEVSDDSTDDGNPSTVIYFSLFAQKRIEVKPGKEILLCLPAANGKFGDQAVVFEGDLPGPGESAEDNGYSAMDVGMEHVVPPIRDILPPKMRRTWTKKVPDAVEETLSLASLPPCPTYSSIAVQVEPDEVPPETPPPLQTYSSIPTQTQEVTRDVCSAQVQTDILKDFAPERKSRATDSAGPSHSDIPERTRSLSPMDMELDSQCSTPRSPAHEPPAPSARISPPSVYSINSSLPGSPRGLTSPSMRSPTYTPSIPILELPSVRHPHEFSTKETPFTAPALPTLPSPAPSVTSLPDLHRLPTATDRTAAPKESAFAHGISKLPTGPRALNSLTSRTPSLIDGVSAVNGFATGPSLTSMFSIPAKRKPVIPNPFVSAGFMTEFSGAAAPKRGLDIPKLPPPPPPATEDVAAPPPIIPHTPVPLSPPPSKPSPPPSTAHPPAKNPLTIEIPSRASTASAMEESPISPVVKDEDISPSIPRMPLPLAADKIFIKEESLSPMQESPVSSSDTGKIDLEPGAASAQARPHTPPVSDPPIWAKSVTSASSERPAIVALQEKSKLPPTRNEKLNSGPVSAITTKALAPVGTSAPKSAPKSATQTVTQRTYIDVDAYVPKHLPPKPSYLPNRPVLVSSSSSTGRRNHRGKGKQVYIDVDAPVNGMASGKNAQAGGSSQISTPPDPRTLSGIYAGPSFNPLGIRQSSGFKIPPQSTAAAANTPTDGQGKKKKKKPVKVGSGWPYAPTAGGANATPLGANRTPSSTTPSQKQAALAATPAAPVQPPGSQPDLRNILSYASRSPSPVAVSHKPEGKEDKGKKPQKPLLNGHGTTDTMSIKAEPVDDMLPLQKPAESSKAGYPLVFDFSTPVPLPPSRKVRYQTAERLGQNQPTTLLSSSTSTSKTLKTNGTSYAVNPHPLPLRPRTATTQATSRETRSLKRGLSPMSREPQVAPPAVKRTIRWPTIESTHRMRIKGDGDIAIKEVVFSADGTQFLVNCDDKTVRIWNNKTRTEMAKLAYNSSVVSVRWMNGDNAIVSLCDDGIVSKWSRTGLNQWQWAKVVDAGTEGRDGDGNVCFAYMRDRIAVAFPKIGVKVWLWIKGTWQPQRSILRQNVTSIKFVEDGEALLGGTKDGVLWYCGVPNGTLRARAFLRSEVRTLDVDPTGNIALVAQVGGRAHLVSVGPNGDGKIQQVYCIKDEELVPKLTHEFGALFANQGQTVLFGSMSGCVLAWDKEKANVLCVLDHCEDGIIQAIAIHDRGTASSEPTLITGTKQGLLNWWSQPAIMEPRSDELSSKRFKCSPE